MLNTPDLSMMRSIKALKRLDLESKVGVEGEGEGEEKVWGRIEQNREGWGGVVEEGRVWEGLIFTFDFSNMALTQWSKPL